MCPQILRRESKSKSTRKKNNILYISNAIFRIINCKICWNNNYRIKIIKLSLKLIYNITLHQYLKYRYIVYKIFTIRFFPIFSTKIPWKISNISLVADIKFIILVFNINIINCWFMTFILALLSWNFLVHRCQDMTKFC